MPEPDLHIYHNKGETIVSAKGGYKRGMHNGQELATLPKSLRGEYRDIIKNFLKKAKRILDGAGKGLRCVDPLIPMPWDFFEEPDPAAQNPNVRPILTPFGVMLYELQPGDLGYIPFT